VDTAEEEASPVSAPPVTEKAFMSAVLKLAAALHWRTYHPWISARSSSGWPDCVFVRERIVYAELKRDGGKPTAAQVDWLQALEQAGAECYLWTPASWPEIEVTLR
jgi:hypothetical protein